MTIPIITMSYILIASLCIALTAIFFIGKNVVYKDPDEIMDIEMKERRLQEVSGSKHSAPLFLMNNVYRLRRDDVCRSDWSITKYLK